MRDIMEAKTPVNAKIIKTSGEVIPLDLVCEGWDEEDQVWVWWSVRIVDLDPEDRIDIDVFPPQTEIILTSPCWCEEEDQE